MRPQSTHTLWSVQAEVTLHTSHMILISSIVLYLAGMLTSNLFYASIQLAVHTAIVLYVVHRLDAETREALWDSVQSTFKCHVDPLVDDVWMRTRVFIYRQMQNITLGMP